MFGCYHNREQGTGRSAFAFGYLMRGSNMATIMAYPNRQYSNWMGFFSNDDYDFRGVRMGTRREDNRRQLLEARFAVARYGNNRGSCSGGGGTLVLLLKPLT